MRVLKERGLLPKIQTDNLIQSAHCFDVIFMAICVEFATKAGSPSQLREAYLKLLNFLSSMFSNIVTDKSTESYLFQTS